MASRLCYRLSGIALLAGGLVMSFTVLDLRTPQPLASVILLLGGGSLVLGLPAVYARQAHQIGWVGLVGLAIIGLDVLVYPVQGGIAGLDPAFALPPFLFAVGPLTTVGTLLFGITTFRARVFPRWLSWGMFVGFMVAGVGNLLLSGTIGRVVGAPGEWLFWLSYSAFGYLLITERRVPQHAAEPMTAQRQSVPIP